ncbi:MAG: family 1 glycosylhydrolase [Candidatus Eremiobacteraeota bacterium]|nr:family 1 glycosylhydrolase [Candidatus Eremiobacteraeota bacterium]MBV8355910.1 family 1 glycosylhydrolase [Candidatus Eremiobacteraeota bacterium]
MQRRGPLDHRGRDSHRRRLDGSIKPFPPEFRFGVATADHQCEAYAGQDEIRDVWERVRGLTPRGNATDFWNRYGEDVDLARGLGCRAFRLSLSWARLEPAAGEWDAGAFAHYRDVLQYMRDAGMATVVTLHHNTWPLHVEAAGNGAGMLDPGFPDRLAAYAKTVAERLGDLIDYYVTLNEPNQLLYGYVKFWSMHSYAVPPGLAASATSVEQMDALLKLIPNLFCAHARARAAIRTVRPTALVGANPLVLGLPRWFQWLIDGIAIRLRGPDDLRRQAWLISQHHLLDSGRVDLSIAQITITEGRIRRVLFSDWYEIAHLCLLHESANALPDDLRAWRGRVGVLAQGAPADQAGFYVPAARVLEFSDLAGAVRALDLREIDAVLDDDVMLQTFADDRRRLTRLRAPAQKFAAAIAPGNQALLNAVDAAIRDFKASRPGMPPPHHKTLAPEPEIKENDGSLRAVRKRGVLRVGVSPGIPGLCTVNANGEYEGLEPDLARHIAARILGSHAKVRFVRLRADGRLRATRSWLQRFDTLRKNLSMYATILGTNWWNLGMAGKLKPFLCPPEAVGALDYVGLDYYWGVPSLFPSQVERLVSAAESSYGHAPVWPDILREILREQHAQFPGKPVIVIENGCVTTADNVARADYIARHLQQVQRSLEEGIPIEAYLCWSITSNREWGLPFDNNSDFGLYHIDLDHDPALKRVPTPAADRYKAIIASRSAEA